MLPFYPRYAANLLEYRYNSLPESYKIAQTFGYNGSMFAWTAYVLLFFHKLYPSVVLLHRAYFGRAQVNAFS